MLGILRTWGKEREWRPFCRWWQDQTWWRRPQTKTRGTRRSEKWNDEYLYFAMIVRAVLTRRPETMGICCNGCLVKTRIRNFSPPFAQNFKDGTDLLVDDVESEDAESVVSCHSSWRSVLVERALRHLMKDENIINTTKTNIDIINITVITLGKTMFMGSLLPSGSPKVIAKTSEP